jgi:hypothetical protein
MIRATGKKTKQLKTLICKLANVGCEDVICPPRHHAHHVFIDLKQKQLWLWNIASIGDVYRSDHKRKIKIIKDGIRRRIE